MILASGTFLASQAIAINAYQNQEGFLTNAQKQMALLDAAGKEVVFKDAGGKEALTVIIPEAKPWTPAGESASLVDFSDLNVPGVYQAYVGDSAIGHPIKISDSAYQDITKGALKFFYYQRASMELTEEFAGKYARPAGHLDTAVLYHTLLEKPDGATFNGAKGWYDAGDYGKYIVNSGITTYTLLQLYQHNKEYFSTLNLNIPESNNDIPDILDEIRWNLEWMLTMQDEEDGGIYHKLTSKQFCGTVMPDKDRKPRFAIGKGIEATWNFIAVMALASEIYAPYDKEFAELCLRKAEKAQMWAINNRYTYYEQPSDVGTGSYTNANGLTVAFWGRTELFRVTKNPVLLDTLKNMKMNLSRAKLQGWASSYMLAAFTIATNPNIFTPEQVDSAKAAIFLLADNYVASLEGNGYGVAMDDGDFYWGSNSVAANKGMVLMHAYILSKEKKYLNATIGLIDYLMGRNPLDKSYLTGFGVNPTMNPHHRPSQADTVEAPIPGMLAGGPNRDASDISACKNFDYRVTGAPAKSYYDNSCSFASNEVAINWNAPFAYIVGSIQAINSTGKVYDVESSVGVEYSIGIKENRKLKPRATTGNRLVFKNGAVQVEHVDIQGNKRLFDLHGKMVK